MWKFLLLKLKLLFVYHHHLFVNVVNVCDFYSSDKFWRIFFTSVNYWSPLHVEKENCPSTGTKDHVVDLKRLAEVAFYVTEWWHSLCKREKAILVKERKWGGYDVLRRFQNFSVISWWSVYWWRRPEYRPVTSHWQSLSHNVVSNTLRYEKGSNAQL